MKKKLYIIVAVFLLSGFYGVPAGQAFEPAMPTVADYSASPIFSAASVPPLVMLVMGRDHKLYYQAYNDASDLNGDGKLDVGYNPEIDYYGYFDNFKCYSYSSNRFNPQSVTQDKTCATGWSGDFLNYVTMSRMDTMRKVLYGGYRSTDTATETVLERAFIPQDAHSWGKEYESIERDGYDIRDYTPLGLPEPGTRHLFANTTLSNDGDPLMRVLNDSVYRIWEWVAIERPVAGNRCIDGGTGPNCATSGGSFWQIVPENVFQDLTQTTYNTAGYSGHPNNHEDFNTLQNDYGTTSLKFGSQTVSNINGGGNPFGDNDYYMTIFEGKINIPTSGTYEFGVDGDDAVEFSINGKGVVASWYGGHGRHCGNNTCDTLDGTQGIVYLEAGQHEIVYRHQEGTGGDWYHLYWKKTVPGSAMVDYVVRVKVGDPSMPEPGSKQYGGESGPYKPVGLLQKYGESDQMYFGLMSGSYAKNMSGGVLRKNIGSINNEIDPDTGQFTSENGIIQTINKFRIDDFQYNNHQYGGGWEVENPMAESSKKFPDWGNPIAEMMYETLRYFANETPTSDYDYSGTTIDANRLGLPKAAWFDPFLQVDGDNTLDLYCAKPIMLVISDINPSYDSDELPGSAFAASGWESGRSLGAGTLHVQERLDAISSEIQGLHFVGEAGSGTYDSACTAKTVNGLGNVRGLCPEEPTKQGGYYAGAVAHYGRNMNLRPDLLGEQKVSTYIVGLSSPLPEIEIPVAGQVVTLVPFGKTVRGTYGGTVNPAEGAFQPTATIVDFFVEEIAEDKSSGKFRINFEDVEQGADHDMDVIVLYEYWVEDDNTVRVKLTKEYQAAGFNLHLGYVISGTTNDGIYLEIASRDDNDYLYFLDTPTDRDGPGRGSSTRYLSHGVSGINTPYSRERTFTPSSDPAATLLQNPLWYAAKWGGDEEGRPWDKNQDGKPDNYFFVINPLELERELSRTFASILATASSGTAASVLATTSRGEGNVLQAYFRAEPDPGEDHEVTWRGYLQSLWVDKMGNIRENTSGTYQLDEATDKILLFESDESGDTKVKRFAVSEETPYPDLTSVAYDVINLDEVIPVWEAGELLLNRSAANRKIYTFTGSVNDNFLLPQSFFTGLANDVVEFNLLNIDTIRPYLGVRCSGEDCAYDYLGEDTPARAANLIEYIRGVDAEGLRSRAVKNADNVEKVWKLGDIINSSPVALSQPPGRYHLIYRDTDYRTFFNDHRNRETVVYVGANDGMLHAFTSGVYDSAERKYVKATTGTEEIGDELWAYIPQSLLPHLKWLPDPEYPHTYYVDQMPLVTDAYVHGAWRTLLIGGLRMGGKSIDVYEDFGDGLENKTFNPTYFCIDITDPRDPKLLWERSYNNMGFSFSVPSVVSEGAGDKWYLVFGSGPTDYDGKSDQKGRLYVVDLATGAPTSTTDDWTHETNDNAFFISPSALDKDLLVYSGNRFTHDYVYIGESIWDGTEWTGNIHRLTVGTGSPPIWAFNPIFSADGPITASMALSTDERDNTWIFLGTGRYIEQEDKISTDQQYLFGFKDPLYNPGRESATDLITKNDLYRVDNLLVTTSGVILDSATGAVSTDTPAWNDLLSKTDADDSDLDNILHEDGWYRELTIPGERCITKPSVFGGQAMMPSFVPNDDICGFGGDSYFYSLYYKTGTAYHKPSFMEEGTYMDGDHEIISDKLFIGHGMPAGHFGIHTGESDRFFTPFLQLGLGNLVQPKQDHHGVRSGLVNWREN